MNVHPDTGARVGVGAPRRATFALVVALLALGPALWIVVPAPTRALLPLSVGAPEIAAWLALTAMIALLPTRTVIRQHRRAQVAAVAAAVALLLALSPFVQLVPVARKARGDLVRTFGDVALQTRPGFRRSTLSVVDLLLGIRQTDPVPTTETIGETFAIISGDTLSVEIYRPTQTGSYPVVVQVYGGAWQRGAPSEFAGFARYIARQGYVVFAIDYRHAPAFRHPSQLTDVRTAIAWIATHAVRFSADTSRIVLLGRSAGAHLAMLAAWAPGAPRLRGVVSYYGPVDLTDGWNTPPSPDPLDVRRVEEALMGGTPAQRPREYRSASPITHVGNTLPPTLLIYGRRDHIVEPRFGRMLHQELQRAGATSLLLELPWADHGFDVVPNGPGGQLSLWVTERFLWAVTRK